MIQWRTEHYILKNITKGDIKKDKKFRDRLKKAAILWASENKERFNANHRRWAKNRYHTDEKWRKKNYRKQFKRIREKRKEDPLLFKIIAKKQWELAKIKFKKDPEYKKREMQRINEYNKNEYKRNPKFRKRALKTARLCYERRKLKNKPNEN